MAKLYPPYIEGTLPAFIINTDGNAIINVPFEYNRGIASAEINGIAIKIKTVQNDVLLNEFVLSGEISNTDTQESIATFSIPSLNSTTTNNNQQKVDFKVGQYYKIQIAFKKDNEVGYFSNVGVAKCTESPSVLIHYNTEALSNGGVNTISPNNNFYGVYSQKDRDLTEKLYSSYFTISNSNNEVIYKSEEKIHSVQNDDNAYTAKEELKFNMDLDPDEKYRIQYFVTTTNGLEVSSDSYLIQQKKMLPSFLKGDLIATVNESEGCINISIKGAEPEERISGTFLLTREDSFHPNFWEEMTRFILNNEYPTKVIYTDFCVEQGKTYTYSIQQYNKNNLFSDRKKSNSVFMDFEDMFLFDGKRQLKLVFNPQISSFKTQLAETKIETIGSKYPTFFRNARVGYKTFPISGLVSMLMDDNDYFISDKEICKRNFNYHRIRTKAKDTDYTPYKHTDLLSENIFSERLFKLEVLDWFNDGKVKLFKSPTEGNYLVRLMDTSLSPNTTLGRMLHTINSTAYECAECNYDNFIKYKIISKNTEILDEYEYEEVWKSFTFQNKEYQLPIDFFAGDKDNDKTELKLVRDMKDNSDLISLELIDFPPGTIFHTTSGNIKIGIMGSYRISNVLGLKSLKLISVPDTEKAKDGSFYCTSLTGATIKYAYWAKTKPDLFQLITDVINNIDRGQQLVGEYSNILEECNSPINKITEVFRVDFHKRPLEYIYYDESAIKEITIEDKNGNIIDQYNTIYPNHLYWKKEDTDPIATYDENNTTYTSPNNNEINKDVLFAHSPFSVYLMIPKSNNTSEDQYELDKLRLKENPEHDFIPNQSLILDPWIWNNKIITINNLNDFYSIGYGDESISLKDIEDFSITEGIEIDSTKKLSMNRGVYAEIYYDTSEISFEFIEADELSTEKNQSEIDFKQVRTHWSGVGYPFSANWLIGKAYKEAIASTKVYHAKVQERLDSYGVADWTDLFGK